MLISSTSLWKHSSGVFFSPVHGNTPAHFATEAGKANCFNCLLQHVADMDAVNDREETPLNTAKKAGHPLLIEKASEFFVF